MPPRVKVIFILYFVSDPESESKSELEQPHHNSAPLVESCYFETETTILIPYLQASLDGQIVKTTRGRGWSMVEGYRAMAPLSTQH